MGYRTYIYCGDKNDKIEDMKSMQILGNNEWYSEWFDEMIRQEMTTREQLEDDEYAYGWIFDEEKDDCEFVGLEVKDIMGLALALEKVAMKMETDRIKERQEAPSEHNNFSYFDFRYRYTKILEDEARGIPWKDNLTDSMFELTEYGYIFMSYSLLNFCLKNGCLEDVPPTERPQEYYSRFHYYRIKKDKKVCISAC